MRFLNAVFFRGPLTPVDAAVLIVTGAGIFLPSPPIGAGLLWIAWWLIVGAAAFLLVRGILGVVGFLLAHAPVKVRRTDTGASVDIRLPTIRRSKKLRAETLALVAEINDFIRAHPGQKYVHYDPALGRNEEEAMAVYRAAQDKLRHEETQERKLMQERFGGRLQHVIDGFVRMGRLTDEDRARLMWEVNTPAWIRNVASRLEGLALDL